MSLPARPVLLVAVLASLLSLSSLGVAFAGGPDAGGQIERGRATTPQEGDATEICDGATLHPALPPLCHLLDRFPPQIRLGIIAALEAHRHALAHGRACRSLARAEHPEASPELAERCRASLEGSAQRGDRGPLAFCRRFVESERAAAHPRVLERCTALLATFGDETPTRAELCAYLARGASADEHPRLAARLAERCATLERSGLEPSGPARGRRPSADAGDGSEHTRPGHPRSWR